MKTNNIKLDRVQLDLMDRDPLSAAIILGLRLVSDEHVKTMATDGETLWYAPSCIEKETEAGLMTMLAHEALHVVSLHPFRQGDKDNKSWNIACDREINNLLDSINETKKTYTWPTAFPSAVQLDPSDRGKPAEEMYSYVEQKPADGNGNQDGEGDAPGWGDVVQPAGDEAELSEKEARAKMMVSQAAAFAQQQGKLPAALARLVDASLNPKADWREILRQFITARAQDDYSWTKPNPRYLSTGFILPSLHSQRLGPIVIAIDTSGSINPTLLNSFLSEVELLCSECRPESLTLIDCDAQINSVRECDPLAPLPRDFKGGGGTDFKPVFAHLDNQDEQPACLIYFTDLLGSFPKQSDVPTLWITDGDRQAPFGTTVKV